MESKVQESYSTQLETFKKNNSKQKKKKTEDTEPTPEKKFFDFFMICVSLKNSTQKPDLKWFDLEITLGESEIQKNITKSSSSPITDNKNLLNMIHDPDFKSSFRKRLMDFSKNNSKSKISHEDSKEIKRQRDPLEGRRLEILRFQDVDAKFVLSEVEDVELKSIENVLQVFLRSKDIYLEVKNNFKRLFSDSGSNLKSITYDQYRKFNAQIFSILKNDLFDIRRFSCGLLIEFINGKLIFLI